MVDREAMHPPDRFDVCTCGHRRGDHEGSEPEPCMWSRANGDKEDCPCKAFVYVYNQVRGKDKP